MRVYIYAHIYCIQAINCNKTVEDMILKYLCGRSIVLSPVSRFYVHYAVLAPFIATVGSKVLTAECYVKIKRAVKLSIQKFYTEVST